MSAPVIPIKGKALVDIYKLTNPDIILPASYKTELSVAKIISSQEYDTDIRVLIPTSAGLNVRENGKSYRLINESDIIAVIQDD